MINREEYLNQLLKWRDEKVIKVITGVRRCGKSTLLKLFQQHLLNNGVSSKQIIAINFEDLDNEELQDYKKLYEYLKMHLFSDKNTYIFLDEIQKVEGFEKVVDSLYIKDNVDIYITGSNAYLLSSELATLLSGRYVEINMLPFSFKEYVSLYPKKDKSDLFAEYLTTGGFPYISLMNNVKEKVDTYLEGIYNTVIVKDIEERQKRKETDPNKRRVNDISLLKDISKYLANAIGNPISIRGIANYITSSGRKVSQNTIADYINALTESYVFYVAERYDVEGKTLLKQNQKIYIVDLGLRRHLLSKRNYDLGFSLENVIFLELLRRGYTVNVGKIGLTEVDFVVHKNEEIQYIQVSASLNDEKTFEREIAPLKKINDNHPKYILTLDKYTLGNYNGIRVINIIDWLLDK